MGLEILLNIFGEFGIFWDENCSNLLTLKLSSQIRQCHKMFANF